MSLPDAAGSGAHESSPANPAEDIAQRLAYEWRHAQREFAFHPHVRVSALAGEPPTTYQVDYRLRTLVVDERGSLVYADTCSVTIDLYDGFPDVPPVVRPSQAIFHPNVDGEQVHFVPAWRRDHSLVDVIQRVGRLLAYQAFDPNRIVNPSAQAWVVANATYIPTDPAANLATDAGGKPIDRIGRSGGASVIALREQLKTFCASLLDPAAAPANQEVEAFASRTRMAAGLFLAGDVPEELVDAAQEIYESADALPGLIPLFERRRSGREQVAALGNAIAELSSANQALGATMAALEQMVAEEPKPEPAEALLQLPPTTELQAALGRLRASLAAAERTYVGTMNASKGLAPVAVSQAPPLIRGVIGEGAAGAGDIGADQAIASANAALAAAEPNIARSRKELGALERLVWWREYVDLARRGAKIAKQVQAWGPAGVQAYSMVNDAGTHGPFDFEQEISFGQMQIAIRPLEPEGLELVDAKQGRVLAKSTDGKTPEELRVRLPGEQPNETVKAAFRRTPTCEALAVQLGYAKRQAEALLGKVAAAGRPPLPTSWPGRYLDRLSASDFYRLSIDQQATTSEQWAEIVAELNALAPFKERVATYHLLARVGEALPQQLADRQDAERQVEAANKRLSDIIARGTPDPTSGQTIIPAKLRGEYEQLLDRVEKQEHRVARLKQAIALAAQHVKHRATAAERFGSADVPQLRAIGPAPAEWADYPAAMADDQILAMVQSIEDQLGLRFLPRKAVGGTAVAAAAAAAGVAPEPTPSEEPEPTPAPAPHPEVEENGGFIAAGDAESPQTESDATGDVIEGWPQ